MTLTSSRSNARMRSSTRSTPSKRFVLVTRPFNRWRTLKAENPGEETQCVADLLISADPHSSMASPAHRFRLQSVNNLNATLDSISRASKRDASDALLQAKAEAAAGFAGVKAMIDFQVRSPCFVLMFLPSIDVLYFISQVSAPFPPLAFRLPPRCLPSACLPPSSTRCTRCLPSCLQLPSLVHPLQPIVQPIA